jgi:hypothetical protein
VAGFTAGPGRLGVSGSLGVDELDEFLRRGRDLLGGAGPEFELDMIAVSPEASAFIGVVAQLGLEARSRSKKVIVRATGRTADWLVWSGLHRIVSLHVSSPGSVPQSAAPETEQGCTGQS